MQFRDRGSARSAGAHWNWHFTEAKAVGMQHQQRLDLGVVMRIGRRKELDRTTIPDPESRGGISDSLMQRVGQSDCEQLDSDPPGDRRLVRAFSTDKSGSADNVRCATRLHRAKQRLQCDRVMLSVAVDLSHEFVAVVACKKEACLHGAPDAKIERQTDHKRASGKCARGRSVIGAVVDDDDIAWRRTLSHASYDRRDGVCFVIGRDDNQKIGALGLRGRIAATVKRPPISVVIVAHDSLSDLRHSLPALIGELGEEDELIVVDSGSKDAIGQALGQITSRAELVPAPGNVGFAAGANLGAAFATGELIVFLNPDTVVQPGWRDSMCAPLAGGWDAWMALVTMESGAAINTSGGVIHFSGVSWAGQAGQPVSAAPKQPREVAFASGACLAIPASVWRRVGGFSEWYFMYCEDVDLSLRLRLQGGAIGVVPGARVIHAYDFHKGHRKWRMLERNRWATIIRCYPTSLLVVLAPALVCIELAIWAVAFRGRWATTKALATADVLGALPRLLHERRGIQRARTISVRVFAGSLTSHLRSPYLGGMARPPIELASRLYWALALQLLRLVDNSRQRRSPRTPPGTGHER